MRNRPVNFILSLMISFTLFSSCSPAVVEDQIQLTDTPAILPSTEIPVNDCDNIFYPMAANNQWNYQFKVNDEQTTGSHESALSLTVIESSDSSAVLAIKSYNSENVTESTVQCQNQAILDFPITELKMVLGELANDINLEYESGIFMPSEQEFIANNWSMEWETNYTANGNLKTYYEGEELTAILDDSPVKMMWKVVGTGEYLQVPAGNFEDLVKMECEISFDIKNLQTNIQGNNINIATTLTLNSELWYAPHIGLIKENVKETSIKLYGINFPIDASGLIELTSYTIN